MASGDPLDAAESVRELRRVDIRTAVPFSMPSPSASPGDTRKLQWGPRPLRQPGLR